MGILKVKSENQMVGDQITKILSQTAVNDINPASVLRTLVEANAQELFQQYIQLVAIIRNYNLDTTTGDDLDKRGKEFGLTRYEKQKATDKIRIQRGEDFVKVSTVLYSGSSAPTIGDTTLRVNDASNVLFGTSGTLIIGRGTSNEEEVTYSAAPTNLTNFWQFAVSPFAFNHGLDESVILKQDIDRPLTAGLTVLVPATGFSPDITFTTDHDVVLLAGEAEVSNVQITAALPGADSNIPVGAITGTAALPSAPFTGARAQNDNKFTTGRDREIDSDYRNRIKNQIQSLSKATKLALLNAIIGLVDATTAKRVVSANIVLPTKAGDPVKIYIDDGTGFEPSFAPEGSETIIDEASGGEFRLRLNSTPLVKAQAENNTAEPYDMSAGTLTLTYTVGLVSETIEFHSSDFAFPAAATAEEISAVINTRATLIESRTSEVGSQVVISAISDTNEDIQVTGGTANGILNFPTDSRSTLYLYVNDVLLSKDGATAFVDTANQATYNFSGIGASPWPLNIVVDGKSANPQVVSFVTGDFSNPAAATAAEVMAAINARLAGATASLISDDVKVRLASNQSSSSKSQLQITGGSANSVLGFPTSLIAGANKDYTLNSELGTIELTSPLAANVNVQAGSVFTRAKLRTTTPENFVLTSGQTLIVTIDGGAPQTVTFGSTGTFTAAQVAALINASLKGATAIVRNVGGLNYLEIHTNTFTKTVGSILISNASTATALSFSPLSSTVVNQRPHRAFVTSSGSAPFNFVQSQNLVIVLDNSPASKTFTVVFDYGATVSSAVSTTVFSALALNTVFSSNSDLVDFYAIAKTGANTTLGSVLTVTNPSGSTFRYAFSALPSNLSSMAIGDHVAFNAMTNSENNGNFIITAVNTSGFGYIEVTNASGVAEAGSTGSALIGQRRRVTVHTGATGAITVASAFRVTPSVGDTFALSPSTIANCVLFMNNKKVSTLATKGVVEASDVNAKIQISSLSEGSDGYVQVTGGTANSLLGFSTATVRGLQGYQYYTGLLKLVHSTVYGDDQDLVSSPGVGAAGVIFKILAPTVQDLAFNVTLTLDQGVSLSNIENDIKSAITGYVNALGVGDDVIRSTVIQKIMEIDGITDVLITTPTGNTAIADNELAKTSDALITIG